LLAGGALHAVARGDRLIARGGLAEHEQHLFALARREAALDLARGARIESRPEAAAERHAPERRGLALRAVSTEELRAIRGRAPHRRARREIRDAARQRRHRVLREDGAARLELDDGRERGGVPALADGPLDEPERREGA